MTTLPWYREPTVRARYCALMLKLGLRGRYICWLRARERTGYFG